MRSAYRWRRSVVTGITPPPPVRGQALMYPLLDDLRSAVVDRLTDSVELVYLDPDLAIERVAQIEA